MSTTDRPAPASWSRCSPPRPSPPRGPFAKSLLETGWTPGSVVFLRIAGRGAAARSCPTVRALDGPLAPAAPRVGPGPGVRRRWRSPLPQLAFFYAVQHLSVGVALLLEYLGLVLVVAWQAWSPAGCPRVPTRRSASCSPLVGLALVLDLFGGVRVDGVGVAWGLLAARRPGVVLPALGHARTRPRCRRWRSPVAGLVVGAVGFAVLGAGRRAADDLPHRAGRAGRCRRCPGGPPCSSWRCSPPPRRTSPGSSPPACSGAKLASFVGLSEVMFAVLFAWLLLGELPRPVQLLGGAVHPGRRGRRAGRGGAPGGERRVSGRSGPRARSGRRSAIAR